MLNMEKDASEGREGDLARIEDFYRKQLGGRKVFWRDKYKAYLSLYAQRRDVRDAAIAAALPARMKRALDVGCGMGDLLPMLGGRAEEACGVDYSSVMVDTARELLKDFPNVRVSQSGAEALPFPDDHFDAVVLGDVIEHIRVPEEALAACLRVLKPGGRLVITTPNGRTERFWQRFDHGIEAPFRYFQKKRPPAPDVFENLLTRRALADLCTGAGFRIVEHRLVEFYPGSEGAGVFGKLLRLIARQRHVRRFLVEPILGGSLRLVATLGIFNNRQLLVLDKPAAARA